MSKSTKMRDTMKLVYNIIFLTFLISELISAQSILQKDFPVLNKVYQADSKKADYVIVIDQSGSMKSYWQNVKNGISALVKSLPEEDYISILGFSNECQALVVPRKLNHASKDELISQINKLPNPIGQKTDLFATIDKTIDEINRPNSNELKFLFFITDFINDPPANTNWNNSNIHLLKEKYERIITQTERLLKLYALQLPLEINAGKDYDKFANIFHTISTPIFLNQSTLLEWFDRLKAEIEREKLRMIVENDTKNAFDVISLENSISLLEKNSHFNLNIINKSLLPLNIDSVIINTEEYGEIKSSGLMTEALPNKALSLKIPLKREMLLNEGLFCKKYPLSVKSFKIFSSTKEEIEFGKLNLNHQKIYVIEKPFSLSFLIGLNCWQILIILILLFLLLYYLFYPCLQPVWLFNKKNIRVSMDLNDRIVELNTREFITNRKNISFDNTIIVEDPVVQTGIRNIFTFTIHFIVQKPKCVIRKPKAGTYVKVDRLPDNANYSFTLYDNISGKSKEYRLGNNLTSEPIDFRRGVRIEAIKFDAGETYRLRIIINTKS